MISFLYSIAGFLVAIAVLVAIHEYGHFWVARTLGVRVLRFSIGFGKPLWTYVSPKDGVEYALSAIPLGGYVKMLDENEGEVAEKDLPRAFNRQPLWKRSLIVLAGPVANFLLAILLFAGINMAGIPGLKPEVGTLEQDSIAWQAGIREGDVLLSVDGREYKYWGQHDLHLYNQVIREKDAKLVLLGKDGEQRNAVLPLSGISAREVGPGLVPRKLGLVGYRPVIPPVLGRVVENTPAENAGLQVGDRILSVEGQAIGDWQAFVESVVEKPGEMLAFEIERSGEVQLFTVIPEKVIEGERTYGRVGVSPEAITIPEELRVTARYSVGGALIRGLEETWLMSALTLRMLGKMLLLKVSPKNISGPITIAQYAGETARIGLQTFASFLAIISISLGVLNLLPIPMLDGGHLLFYLGEAVTRRPVPEKVMLVGQQLGLVLLLGLMCLAFYNDIFRLVG